MVTTNEPRIDHEMAVAKFFFVPVSLRKKTQDLLHNKRSQLLKKKERWSRNGAVCFLIFLANSVARAEQRCKTAGLNGARVQMCN